MKQLLIALALAVALAGAVVADHIHLDTVRVDEAADPGSQMRAYVRLGSGAQIDPVIQVSIPDLGVARRGGPYGENKGLGHSVYLDIPEDTPSGEYVVRISVKDDEHAVVRHRFVWID